MKKLLIIISLFISFSAVGQISWGVKGGYNQNSLILSNNTLESVSTGGFHLGIFSELRIGPTLSIQPEVLYQTSGGKIIQPVDGVLDTVTHEIHALSLPGLVCMRLGAVSIDVGASYNYIFDFRTRTSSGRSIEDDESWSAESDIRAILGLQVRLGRVRVSARATRNLTAFDEREFRNTSGVSVLTDVHLMSLQAGLGLTL